MVCRRYQLCLAATLAVLAAAVVLFLTRPIKIGVILPLDSSLGNEENLFVRYWQQQRGRLGLRPVRFLIENPEPVESAVRASYRRLANRKVSAIIGGVLSRDAVWLAEEAARSELPTFGITASSSSLQGLKDSFYRIAPTNDTQARLVADFLNGRELTRLAILASPQNAVYVDSYKSTLRAAYAGSVAEFVFYQGFSALPAIEVYRPDAVFLIMPAKDVVQLVHQLRQAVGPVWIGVASWGALELMTLYAGPQLTELHLFSLDTKTSGESFLELVRGFEESYQLTATNGTHYTVSLLSMLYEGIREAGTSPQRLKAWFDQPRTYETIYGPISVDEYGDSTTGRNVIYRIADGVMLQVDK